MTHLTDEELQNYLDGNISPSQASIFEQHLESCKKCQVELEHYQSLYAGLKDDTALALSPDFSNAVIKAVHAEAKKAFLARLWNMLLPVLGIAVGIGVMVVYVDFKPFLKAFGDSLNPTRYFDNAVLTNLNEVLGKLNVNLNLIVFAGLSLLAVIGIDQVLSRHKEKFFSYLKILPVM
jgi:anti-sigma factor RsiW